MKTIDTANGLLSVLASALSPGMVLDETTVDGMLTIIQQVKRSLEEVNSTPSKL